MTDARYPTTPMCDGAFLELFEPTTRDSDVFVSTAPKCGQTWLQTLLFHLATRGHVPDLGGKALTDVSPWLEIPGGMFGLYPVDRRERLAHFESLADPRIFKLHVVWPEIPRPAGSKARVMTIVRDPRDVPYSMFCHLQAMKRPVTELPVDFPTYLESWFERGFYFEFMKSFWCHRGDPDVLILRYEQMHDDLRAQTGRILDFLGWKLGGEDIDRVLPLVDFKRMRAREDEERHADSPWKEGKFFFREGAVGKNRAHLTGEQEQRILDRLEREVGADFCDFVLSG